MPATGSFQYTPSESPASVTSTGTADIKTIQPTVRRANGVFVCCETTAARMTFDGTAPGAGTGPGLVIPTGVVMFFPFAGSLSSSPNTREVIKFASAAAGNSVVSVMFVT